MINQSTVDNQEIDKFNQHATLWWDTNGPLKTLHDINATRIDFINHYLPINNTLILDVGCGGGILSEAMAKLGAHVTGIDASREAIHSAKEHAQQNNLSINYQTVPIEDYDHPGFDAITCMELVEHVQEPSLVLEHCKRLLKPGGFLFLSTINRTLKAYGSAILAAEYILGILPRQTHEYNKFIKPSELAKMGRAVGLTIKDIKGLAYNPFTRKAVLSNDVSVNYLLVLESI